MPSTVTMIKIGFGDYFVVARRKSQQLIRTVPLGSHDKYILAHPRHVLKIGGLFSSYSLNTSRFFHAPLSTALKECCNERKQDLLQKSTIICRSNYLASTPWMPLSTTTTTTSVTTYFSSHYDDANTKAFALSSTLLLFCASILVLHNSDGNNTTFENYGPAICRLEGDDDDDDDDDNVNTRKNSTSRFRLSSRRSSTGRRGSMHHQGGRTMVPTAFGRSIHTIPMRKTKNADTENNDHNNGTNKEGRINSDKKPTNLGGRIKKFFSKSKSNNTSNSTKNDLSIDHGKDDNTTADTGSYYDEDCPICKKYGKGPCGKIFRTWLKCTDEYRGQVDETTGEDLHVSKCEHLALPLAECLRDHEDYYNDDLPLDDEEQEETKDEGESSSLDENEVESSDEAASVEELKIAWENLVKELESTENRKIQSFPDDMKPEMQVRMETNVGMAAFALQDDDGKNGSTNKPLILAYVKDQKGTLLGAGSRDDIEIMGQGLLRFDVSNETTSVIACAVYGDEDDAPIYTRRELLPPRDGK